MGALEAVLQLKAAKEAQAQQQSDNITQAVQLLNNAKQQANENQYRNLVLQNTLQQQGISNEMANKQYSAGLAEKGLIPDKTNPSGFRYDATLTNPLANIISATKLQADAKTANNPQIYQMAGNALNALVGTPIGNTIKQVNSPTTSTDVSTLVQPEQNALMNQNTDFYHNSA